MPAKTISKPKAQRPTKSLGALAIAATAHLKLHPGLELPRLQRKLGFTPDRSFTSEAPSSNARKAIAALEAEGVIRIEPPSALYLIPRAFLQNQANPTRARV